MSLIGVFTLKVGPQRWMRCEDLSPSTAHVSQRDRALRSAIPLPAEVRNESENLGRDAVDRGKGVPPGTDQAEDVESVLLKNADLKGVPRK